MNMRPWKWKQGLDFRPGAFDGIATRFAAGFYEQAIKTDPENVDLLVTLGSIYSEMGKLRKSLEVDLRLVQVRPDEPVFHYNLACSYSLAGQLDPAFAALRKAIELGYTNLEHLTNDRDLDNLKSDRRFADLLELHHDN